MEKRRGERIHFSQLVGSHTTFGLFSKRERYDNRMSKQVSIICWNYDNALSINGVVELLALER